MPRTALDQRRRAGVGTRSLGVAGVAQLVRAPDCDSGCRRFEPGHSPQFFQVVMDDLSGAASVPGSTGVARRWGNLPCSRFPLPLNYAVWGTDVRIVAWVGATADDSDIVPTL